MFDLASAWLEQLAQWASDHRFLLINAGLLLAAGWLAARSAAHRVRRLGRRLGRADSPYRRLVATLVRLGILALVVVAALPVIGFPTLGPILLFATFAIVVALVAQAPLRNLAAGATIHATRVLKVGDQIECVGTRGTVTEVGLLATCLRSDDGVFTSIPNARLSGSVVRNFSRLGSRRVEVTITVGYDQDIEEVIALCRDLAESNGMVLRDPPPEVVVSSLRATAITIAIRAWTGSATHADAAFQLNREIKNAFDAAGIHWAPSAPRRLAPTAEPPAYISTAFRSRIRSRAIEP
jgi:Small-conductance mechanosensitive channel